MLCENCSRDIKPVEHLLLCVTQVTGVSPSTMLGKDRHKHLSIARQIAWLLMQRELRWSTTSIAAYFRRDHASISIACKKMRKAVALEEHPAELIREARNVFYRDHLPTVAGEAITRVKIIGAAS